MFPPSREKIKLTLEISFEQRLLGKTKNVTNEILKQNFNKTNSLVPDPIVMVFVQ